MVHISTMKKMIFFETVINFLKCGLTGLCLEVIFTSLVSLCLGDLSCTGKTSLLMFPIYGMGAFLRPIGEQIDRLIHLPKVSSTGFWEKNVAHGCLYMILIFIAEYICGFLLRAQGICPWDYTGSMTSIDGLVRLDFAPLWFGTGLLFEQITKRNFINLNERQF